MEKLMEVSSIIVTTHHSIGRRSKKSIPDMDQWHAEEEVLRIGSGFGCLASL